MQNFSTLEWQKCNRQDIIEITLLINTKLCSHLNKTVYKDESEITTVSLKKPARKSTPLHMALCLVLQGQT